MPHVGSPDDARAGPRAAGRAHVGCSGWSYAHWRGVVYPSELPQRRWFEHYASLFDTVELNATLYRLPPRWRRDPERLDDFLTAAPAALRWAVELRDPSWLHDDVLAVPRAHEAALCIHDLLPDHPWVRTAGWAYVRFHGPAPQRRPYEGAYGPARLEPVAARLRGWLDDGVDVYAYFNNDIGGHAVADARWLAVRLGLPAG